MATVSITDLPLLDERQINQLITSAEALNVSATGPELSAGKTGEFLSSEPGSGLEFDDLRQFQVGDDQKSIDWRASARSQQTLVRTYFAEYQQPVFFVIDRSASMRFGSQKRLKVTQAVRLALWLSGIYLRKGHELGGMLLGQSIRWFEPRPGFDALHFFASQASSACPPIKPQSLEWRTILSTLKERIPTGSRVFLLSDFISLEQEDTKLLNLVGYALDIQAVHITDPLELQFQLLSGLQLDWGQQAFQIDNTEDLVHLEQSITQHKQFLSQAFRKAGINYTEFLSTVEKFEPSELARLR